MSREASLDRLSDYSEKSLLEELRRVARLLGKNTLVMSDIETHARCSYAILKMRFGGLRPALRAAGLASLPFHRNVPDEKLLDELERVWDVALEAEGRRPYRDDLAKYGCQFSQGPYLRRWGSWIKACEAVLERSARGGGLTSERTDINPIETALTARATRPKRPIPLKLRYDVMKRDSFRCVLCGRSPAACTGLKLHVDHKYPEWAGGPATIQNLRTLCDDCNVGRGAAHDEV